MTSTLASSSQLRCCPGNFIVKNDYAYPIPHLIDNLFELTLSQYVTWKSLADADNGFPANLDPKVAYQFAQFFKRIRLSFRPLAG